MSDRDRENTAVHESGHAAVSFRLFRRCGVVSIEPNEHWRGVTLFGRPELKLLTDREGPSTFNRPAYLLSAPVRRKLEYAGMVYLGGPLAAQFMIPSARFGIDACEEAAMEVAEVLAGPPQLTSKEVAMLEAAKSPGDPDAEKAHSVASLLAGAPYGEPTLIAASEAWLRAATIDLISRPPLPRMIEAIAEELLRYTTLPGRTVREILQGAEGR